MTLSVNNRSTDLTYVRHASKEEKGVLLKNEQ